MCRMFKKSIQLQNYSVSQSYLINKNMYFDLYYKAEIM